MSDKQDTTLPVELVEAARKVIEANRARGKRIAVAESCTGGLVATALTEIAGSSDVFEAGFATYSNEAKMDVLGVSLDVLETFGAVSVAVDPDLPVGFRQPVRALAPLAAPPASPEAGCTNSSLISGRAMMCWFSLTLSAPPPENARRPVSRMMSPR